MSQASSRQYQPPKVDTTEVLARKPLEAELFSLDGQIRKFDRIREQLGAAGKDASAYYRQLQSRRLKLAAALKQSRSGSVPPVLSLQLPMTHLKESLLLRSIERARFDSKLGIFGFGSSGVVQVAPAEEDTNVLPQGPFPHSGEIVTIPGSYPGNVTFGGHLMVGPDQIPPDQYDPTINYFWIRNWQYLIPFPPPTMESRLTYRFDVYVNVSLLFAGGEANMMSFVSLGETSNLTTGTNVPVSIDGGWPLTADLKQPSASYNGYYGAVDGSLTVQRSFMVPGGHVPGVAVIVGVIGALSMMAEVDLNFGEGISRIAISSENMVGRVEYTYEPQLVAHL